MSLPFPHKHLLGIEGLSRDDISTLLERANQYAENQVSNAAKILRGKTIITLFFEDSTRTRSSFELAGKRLGANLMNMALRTSSMGKGETLIDTAVTLNAMSPDLIVIRHSASGAVALLSQKVDCSVVNAGDGAHEHPTQALLDALTIQRAKGGLEGLRIAICGDILHSRVARSNIHLLTTMGAKVNVIAPTSLLPKGIEDIGAKAYTNMREGLKDCDIVMALRLQRERMGDSFIPSTQEYFHRYGLDREKLSYAKPDALVMHPGPMNRGVEIDSDIADDPDKSLIRTQVSMGIAVRMAALDLLSQNA
ncbi:MAG: aspartate carbamoyltransferase catalytic subunit [Hyphomicrobiales bacterium]|nr:aspartate carbamoyltransferase catalytic subunit [Hyphomicrobiales bacterium]